MTDERPIGDVRRRIDTFSDLVEWADDVAAHGAHNAGARWQPVQAEHAFAVLVRQVAQLQAVAARVFPAAMRDA